MGCYLYDNPVVITALIASLVAIWGVVSQRLISRRKATADLIFTIANDRDSIQAQNQFAKSKEAGDLESYANPGKTICDEARKIQLILNNYENVAIGIKRGTLDYNIIKDNWRSSIIYHWENGEAFIIKSRRETSQATLWKEFEVLYGWVKDDKKPPLKNRISNLFF